ncbi:MAG: hypothetical protein DRP01_04425 [Archaeoglobales archaeon]|nr:MAG: hypothetical protein DRP01_04425 [Archaeoglobales archaeon]
MVHIEETIPVGTVGFSFDTNDLISWLIRLFMWSKISHTFLVIPNNKIIEATAKGVVVRDFKKYLKPDKRYRLYKPVNLDNVPEKVAAVTAQYVGKSYGFLQLFGILLGMSFRCVFRRDLPFAIFKRGLVCSELVWLYLMELHEVSDAFDDFRRNFVTPEDLRSRIKETLHFERLYL